MLVSNSATSVALLGNSILLHSSIHVLHDPAVDAQLTSATASQQPHALGSPLNSYIIMHGDSFAVDSPPSPKLPISLRNPKLEFRMVKLIDPKGAVRGGKNDRSNFAYYSRSQAFLTLLSCNPTTRSPRLGHARFGAVGQSSPECRIKG